MLSEDDRLGDIGKAINDMSVNTVFLTPSVSRLVQPSQVPTLQTILTRGETSRDHDFERWAHLPATIHVYGPTECTAYCSLNDCTASGRYSGQIGTALGSVSWIVSPTNHGVLAPIGTIGELLVEGNILARGYLGSPEKTAAVFIDSPSWLRQGTPGRQGRTGRLYKTGNLVRYNADGSLVYLGRKDT